MVPACGVGSGSRGNVGVVVDGNVGVVGVVVDGVAIGTRTAELAIGTGGGSGSGGYVCCPGLC